jgi:molybdopterin synthase sulfur carrier subunit
MPRDNEAAQVTAGTVTVRYWAGARAAAGVESDVVEGRSTVADVVAAVDAFHPGLGAVTAVSTLLLDGRAAHRDQHVPDGSVLEVLPPFAGG